MRNSHPPLKWSTSLGGGAGCAFNTSKACHASQRQEQDKLMKEMSEKRLERQEEPGPGVQASRPQIRHACTVVIELAKTFLWLSHTMHGSSIELDFCMGGQTVKAAAEMGSCGVRNGHKFRGLKFP